MGNHYAREIADIKPLTTYSSSTLSPYQFAILLSTTF